MPHKLGVIAGMVRDWRIHTYGAVMCVASLRGARVCVCVRFVICCAHIFVEKQSGKKGDGERKSKKKKRERVRDTYMRIALRTDRTQKCRAKRARLGRAPLYRTEGTLIGTTERKEGGSKRGNHTVDWWGITEMKRTILLFRPIPPVQAKAHRIDVPFPVSVR